MARVTVNDINRICPYCGNKIFVEGEDYDEDARVEECQKCGKKHIAYEVFCVEHWAMPDCEINGKKHNYGNDGFCIECFKKKGK